MNGLSLVELHVEPAAARVVVALAGHALVGRRRGGAAPRTVEVEAWIGEEGRNERALHSHFHLSEIRIRKILCQSQGYAEEALEYINLQLDCQVLVAEANYKGVV